MKLKNLKDKKTKKAPTPENQPEPESQYVTESQDEAYRQVNRVCFQQNFQVLINHYKGESSASR